MQDSSFVVPLRQSAHLWAQRICQQHKDSQRVKQIYLNILAVSAVEFYLGCMGVRTNWAASQSYDPIMQLMLDIADLELPGKGRLECRPLLPKASTLVIPPEARDDRIAYVAVQFTDALQNATLLGFAPAGCQEIALDQLRSLDTLMSYLNQIQPAREGRIPLRQWLENRFEMGWQSLASLTGTNQPRLAAALRNRLDKTTIQRAKRIVLGEPPELPSVALVVAITPLESDAATNVIGSPIAPPLAPQYEIWVQLHPVDDARFLPPNISLIQRSTDGETLQSATSRLQDNYIQIKRFRGVSGECFDIQVAFDNRCTTETFVI